MKKISARLLIAGSVTGVLAILTATEAALACSPGSLSGCAPTTVPEISATHGSAALATVAAVMLIAWERRRFRRTR